MNICGIIPNKLHILHLSKNDDKFKREDISHAEMNNKKYFLS